MKKLIGLVLVALVLATSYSCSSKKEKTEEVTESAVSATMKVPVSGACGMCKTRIENIANSFESITDAVWDAETQTLTFAFDLDNEQTQALGDALAAAGHDNGFATASDEAYNALPGCCHYREL
jgi:Cu(I)/Ag(I) efflux system membrane fusion protein